jgi:hypothetical protein
MHMLLAPEFSSIGKETRHPLNKLQTLTSAPVCQSFSAQNTATPAELLATTLVYHRSSMFPCNMDLQNEQDV